MSAETVNLFWDLLDPSRIFGPIFDKELRVSSRRRRNYFMRSTYIILLIIPVIFAWLSIIGIRYPNSNLYYISRSSQIGRVVILAISWFQFVALQIVAIIIQSSSISDETRRGTLNVLMTTPVNSFQIVIGKLLSKLLQVFLLLAISLPLLAIIRVFGGIPWYYVISSFFITFTAVIFAGSLSLFLSIYFRYAYRVIIIQFGLYLFVFAAIPVLIAFFNRFTSNWLSTINNLILYVNPFWAMVEANQQMPAPSIKIFSWPIHGLIMLCVSGILLGLSIWKVRSVALQYESGKQKKSVSRNVVNHGNITGTVPYLESSEQIKSVTGNPIIWKENYKGLFRKRIITRILTVLLIFLFCIAAFSLLFLPASFGMIFTNLIMAGISLILTLRLAVSTAGSIAGEKEAKTLAILLVTPLMDRDIILSKVKAGIMRNVPLFILYFCLFFIMYFSYIVRGTVEFSQIIYLIPAAVISIAGMIVFISGCGAYFGVCMKSSTGAIAATIGIYFGVEFIFGNLTGLFMMVLLSFLAKQSFVGFFSFVFSIMRVIFLAGIGLFFLKLSIRKLRSSVF